MKTKSSDNHPRYDGVQLGLFGEVFHCYTILNKRSPAHGASFSVEGSLPTDAEIQENVRRKEVQFQTK
jgi:hypothetical protein